MQSTPRAAAEQTAVMQEPALVTTQGPADELGAVVHKLAEQNQRQITPEEIRHVEDWLDTQAGSIVAAVTALSELARCTISASDPEKLHQKVACKQRVRA